MSHELNLAVAVADQPLLLAGGGVAGLAVLVLLIVVMRKARARKRVSAIWQQAADELDIDVISGGSDLGPTVRGKVNDHVVNIAPLAAKRRKRPAGTLYSVKYEAPEAPKFRLNKRMDEQKPIIDTGNPKFDAVVAISTDQPVLLGRYLTAPRRAAILRLLTYWPSAEITNRESYLFTPGMEHDVDKLVDSICHLVASAETFDRPTSFSTAESDTTEEAEATAETDEKIDTAVTTKSEVDPRGDADSPDEDTAEADVLTPIATQPAATHTENGEHDVLTEIRLDEVTVLHDLFNTGLAIDQIAGRFEQVYQGREVTWAGEVVRVGVVDESGVQRIAALVGSADGKTADSGRVVAITAVAPEPVLSQGDVVTFSGSLVNLDPVQRLFHLA